MIRKLCFLVLHLVLQTFFCSHCYIHDFCVDFLAIEAMGGVSAFLAILLFLKFSNETFLPIKIKLLLIYTCV